MFSNTYALGPTKGAKPTKGIHSNMKSAHLIAVALGGIALVAGAASLNTAYVHIDRAQGNNGTGSYSMMLDNTTNTLFQGVSGAGTASSISGGKQSTVGFASYVYNGEPGKSKSATGYTMWGAHSGIHMILTNTSPIYNITSMAITFSPEAVDRMGNFRIYTSSTAFSSETDPFSDEGFTQVLSGNSGETYTDPFAGNEDHYFAILFGGNSSHTSNAYYITLSKIVIGYDC